MTHTHADHETGAPGRLATLMPRAMNPLIKVAAHKHTTAGTGAGSSASFP